MTGEFIITAKTADLDKAYLPLKLLVTIIGVTLVYD